MHTVLTVSDPFAHSPNSSGFSRPLKDWIDSNTLYRQPGFVWNIGIADAENILAIESIVRQDMSCKHFKCWRTNSFKEAMETLREVVKSPIVFKSQHNRYASKGSYIFIYKTVVQKNCRLFHTLRF